jgi:hypothetical protein
LAHAPDGAATPFLARWIARPAKLVASDRKSETGCDQWPRRHGRRTNPIRPLRDWPSHRGDEMVEMRVESKVVDKLMSPESTMMVVIISIRRMEGEDHAYRAEYDPKR